MEACASAHFWADKLMSMVHNVKLMAPQFVNLYVKTNKYDAADAEAICEAVTRPNMRFALNQARQHPQKDSMRSKLKQAGWSDKFRSEIIPG